MGTPVAAVPAIAAFFGVEFAVAILLPPNAVSNFVQLWQFRDNRRNLPFVPPMILGGGVGVAAGTWLLVSLPENALTLTLGLLVVAYVALRLFVPAITLGQGAARRLALPVGLASGVLQGATGISAPVSGPYMNAMRLTRDDFVFGITALFCAFLVVQIPAAILAGVLTWERALYGVLAIVPVLAGMPVGAWLARRMSPAAFDRLVLTFLAAMAAKLLWSAGAG